jgi:hypothetical protein
MWAFVVAAALAAGCSSKVSGEIEVNGKKVGVSSCRNGVVYGYRGVEVTTKDGDRLRVAMTQTGEAWLVFMPKGSSTGSEIGACGTLEVSDQNSTINDVKNVEGKMELDCASDGLSVKGTVKFENCH